MKPAADVIAAGAPIDMDCSKIEPGQQVVVRWRGIPILIVNGRRRWSRRSSNRADRYPGGPELPGDAAAALCAELAPIGQSGVGGDGGYLHASGLPAGVYPEAESDRSGGRTGRAGILCPCHGSKYDLAGRVYQSVPAPDNLPVPPYTFTNDKTVRIGENPTGVTYELSQVVQL